MYKIYFGLLSTVFLAACGGPADRLAQADIIAGEAKLSYVEIKAPPFLLAAWMRLDRPGEPISVYIEGDGLAWLDRHHISADPTPKDPVALKLAAQDRNGNVVYLARPCQYLRERQSEICRSSIWTNERFSRTLVGAESYALDDISRRGRSQQLNLIGYSGGGALALLAAALRSDIASIRTVAGLLDHKVWTEMRGLSPLSGSLNPVDAAVSVSRIPQIHFIGSTDTTVPPEVAQSFAERLPAGHCADFEVLDNIEHHADWPDMWPRLLEHSFRCQ